MAELGASFGISGVLAGADRELAILTAGREVEAVYEWHGHEPIGLRGRRPSRGDRGAAAPAADGRPGASARRVIIDLVRSLYRDHKIPDDLYARADAELGRKGLVEMIVLAGYYGLSASC